MGESDYQWEMVASVRVKVRVRVCVCVYILVIGGRDRDWKTSSVRIKDSISD